MPENYNIIWLFYSQGKNNGILVIGQYYSGINRMEAGNIFST